MAKTRSTATGFPAARFPLALQALGVTDFLRRESRKRGDVGAGSNTRGPAMLKLIRFSGD
jgi:hypothetical protein